MYRVPLPSIVVRPALMPLGLLIRNMGLPPVVGYSSSSAGGTLAFQTYRCDAGADTDDGTMGTTPDGMPLREEHPANAVHERIQTAARTRASCKRKNMRRPVRMRDRAGLHRRNFGLR